MYNRFFGFKEKPFELTPNPKFMFMTPVYDELLSTLIYGIIERHGLIAVVGDIGTGKTMTLYALMKRLDPKHKVVLIFNSDLTFLQMMTMVLCDLGLAKPHEHLNKAEAILRLKEYAIKQLKEDGKTIIIIDEAQHLSDRTMENLRMLTNLETGRHKLVQIVLCGQLELDDKLSKPEWRPIVQRISLKRYSTELNEGDTYRYIAFRLKTAGYEGEELFGQDALELIWQYSEGIPRKINILCDNALLIGYALESKIIDEHIINEVVQDLTWSPHRQKQELEAPPSDENNVEFRDEEHDAFGGDNRKPKRLNLLSGMVLLIVLFLLGWFLLNHQSYELSDQFPFFKTVENESSRHKQDTRDHPPDGL